MTAPVPEFSRRLTVAEVPGRGCEIDLVAGPGECAALAARFAIPEIRALTARVRLRRLAGGLVRVAGSLAAEVVQSCVVTLCPVVSSVADRFDITFGAAPEGDEDELDLSFDSADPPEPIVDGTIDVGEVVAEHLALALDPFPRSADAVFTPPEAAAPAEESASPFAILSRLRKNEG